MKAAETIDMVNREAFLSVNSRRDEEVIVGSNFGKTLKTFVNSSLLLSKG
jgi:hypothetical protein